MKNNPLRCSTFFAPDFDKSIQMSEYLRNDLKWNAYAGSEVNDTSRLSNWIGIADWRKQNQNYAELRTKLELDSMTNHEIGKIIRSKVSHLAPSTTKSDVIQKPWQSFPTLSPQKITDVIFYSQFEDRSKEWILENFGISFKQIKEVEKWFKSITKNWKSSQRSIVSMMRRKLHDEHITEVKNYLQEKKGAVITIKMVKEHLIDTFPSLSKISDFNVRRFLKKDMRYSYKKLSKKKPITKRQDRVRLYYESVAIQIWLEDQGIELIYWDEFTVSTRNYTYYGWAPQNSQVIIVNFEDEAKFNILIGFSA